MPTIGYSKVKRKVSINEAGRTNTSSAEPMNENEIH